MRLLHNFLSSKSIEIDFFYFPNIQFGLFLNNDNVEYVVNNVIIVTKFYKHKCRFSKCSPSFCALMKEISLFERRLSKIQIAKAEKLLFIIYFIFICFLGFVKKKQCKFSCFIILEWCSKFKW